MSTGIPSGPPDQISNITALLRATPELAQSPGAAVALSQTSAPAENGQAVGYALNQQALGSATQSFTDTAGAPPKKKSGGLLHEIGGAVGHVVHDVTNDVLQPVQRDVMNQRIPGIQSGPFKTIGGAIGATPLGAMNLANVPLKQVQHEYRYIHDVWQRHGPIPAIAEMLTMGAAGVATGYATDSTNLGVLGAEGAGFALGNLAYRDSWERTANGSAYRDSSGQNVSPGRDVANLLGVGRKGLLHGVVSGGMDGVFDILTDPVQRAGGFLGEAKTSEGNKFFSGVGAKQPGDAVALYQRPAYDQSANLFRRGVNEIADTGSAAQIARRFGDAITRIPGLANELAQTTTPDQVLQVFEDHLSAQAALGGQMTWAQSLPVTSKLEQSSQGLIDAFENKFAKARSLETLPLGGTWDPTGDAGWSNIRQQLLMGLSPDAVNTIGDQYLATELESDRVGIVKTATKAMLIARAGLKPEELDGGVQALIDAKLDEVMADAPNHIGEYGTDPAGSAGFSNLQIPNADGSLKATVGAAGWEGQLAPRNLLDYGDVKDLAQQVRGYNAVFNAAGFTSDLKQAPLGAIDDFAWEHFTRPWAKMALLTGAFAAHITAAEDFLNVARLGLGDMVRGALDGEIGKMGYQVSKEEAGPITALVYRLLGSPDAEEWAALKEDPSTIDKVSQRVKVAVATDGHMVAPEVAANHIMPTSANAPTETMRNGLDVRELVVPKGMKVSDTYRMFGQADPNYDIWLGQHLNQIVSSPGGPAIAQAYLDAARNGASEEEGLRAGLEAARQSIDDMSPQTADRFLRTKYTSIDGVDPQDAFAQWRLNSVLGASTGADGQLNADLLGKIAQGDPISYKDVQDIPRSHLPAQIPGREMMKDPSSVIDRIAEIGHRKVLSPFINTFSRMPTFMAGVDDAYEAYKPLVGSGLLDSGQATDMAMQDASRKMIQFIHNPQERLQLTETMRNVAPFWFAQVQAYKRYGRLLLEDPGAFRRAQLVLTGMTNLSNRANAANGTAQAIYPGSGYVTHGMLGALASLGMPVTSAVPVSFAGSTSSLQAVDPFMEGTSSVRPNPGPLVAVAAHLIDGFDPRAINFISSVVGPTTGAEASQERGAFAFGLGLIPNTPLRDVTEGFFSTPGLLRSNDTIWMQTLANLDYQQNVALAKWQQTDQFKNWVASGGDPGDPNAPGRPQIVPSPEAPATVRQDFVDTVKMQSRFVRLVQAVMAEVTPASPQPIIGNQKIPKVFQDMVAKDGLANAYVEFATKYPTAGPLIQAMSDITGGGVLASSKDAISWVDKNLPFVNANKDIASFFVPQLQNEQYDSSAYNEEIAMGLRTRKTPQEFQNDFYVNTGWADYDANRAIYNQDLANGADPTTEKSNWDQWLTTFKAQNPAWASVYDSQDNQINAQQQFQEVQQVLASGKYPQTPQVAVMQQLIDSYNNHLLRMVPSANGSISPTSAANIEETQSWEAWLKQTAASAPETAPFINKVLRWLT